MPRRSKLGYSDVRVTVRTPLGEGISASPLWMVLDEPDLHHLVAQLRTALVHPHGRATRVLDLSRRRIEAARSGFGRMILHGERDLHMLAGLLAGRLIPTHRLRSIVIGEVGRTGDRFTLEKDLDEEELYRSTDLDLGNRLLSRLRFSDGDVWHKAELVSNVVAYEALDANPNGVTRILTRIKAEEEIWNKVADELFELDHLVERDKALRHLSRYVKDVFGLKIVVSVPDDVRRAHDALQGLAFEPHELEARAVQGAEHRRLNFLEVKDYLDDPKNSGWAAMKSVVRWRDRTFEIQVQPLQNFLRERERLTRESHASFKATREQVRDEVAARVPLFGYCRALLQWIFVSPQGPPPEHPGVEVRIHD
ncbi:MAG: hypothetical protein H6730_14670 [Deltaproteobacteria bacterium]|nr:hypothetical protein [Deltaproteobacteria bacterium]